jgi:YggT family protein
MLEVLYNILTIAFYILTVYFYIMIAYVLLSWTPLVNSNFYRLLGKIVNPYLGVFRGWFTLSGIDFTPMLGLILFQLLLSFIARALGA